MKKRGIRIALKGGHEFYQKGYSKGENFQYNVIRSGIILLGGRYEIEIQRIL